MDVFIIGGVGGIGRALIKQLLRQYRQARVHATYYRQLPDHTDPRLTWHKLDVLCEHNIAAISHRFSHMDWVINCVGMLHDDKQGPEKSLASVDPDFFSQNMATNTLPTLLLAKHFTPLVAKSANPKLVTLSARVGSISDNQLGGWYSYRASKAALNMLIKTIAIEWQRSIKHGCVLALHPGTTNTPLSKPFQKNVPESKLFTPDYVAQQLLSIVVDSTPHQSGSFYSYSGEEIPW
jgi:NAD(P)-dependent dehydrogenase (short-subunit alcohol dehydrogenase family)